jgi:hypothetical protein
MGGLRGGLDGEGEETFSVNEQTAKGNGGTTKHTKRGTQEVV